MASRSWSIPKIFYLFETHTTLLINYCYFLDNAENNLYRKHRIMLNLYVKTELNVIGLCVKQATSSDIATLVFEIRNKSTLDFEVIQRYLVFEDLTPLDLFSN